MSSTPRTKLATPTMMMASTTARRSSYHLDAECRASLKATRISDCVLDAFKTEKQPDQQEPSPQMSKRPTTKADDSSTPRGELVEDDDNNQEKETTGKLASTEQHGHGDGIRNLARVGTSQREKKTHQLHHSRKQAALMGEPPLTTARLRQEKADLKLEITQLSNQHEAEIQVFQTQLSEAASAYHQNEQKLKTQIGELEKRQLDMAMNAHKYQSQVEGLQQMLRTLETTMKDKCAPPPSPLVAQSPATPLLRQPQTVLPTRRGNGTPLPYGHHAKYGGVKPFAWRNDASQSMERSSSVGLARARNQYRLENLSPCKFARTQPAAYPSPTTGRYIPVSPPYAAMPPMESHESACPPSTFSMLFPPPSVANEQQLRQYRVVPLEKKPSGNLLSYCADLISSKLSQVTEAAPSPSMKVMPIPDLATTPALPEDYTAITIL